MTKQPKRVSFRSQAEESFGANRRSKNEHMPTTLAEKIQLAVEIEQASESVTSPFESKFYPGDMRQLALVAHNHMKPAMKDFIETYSEVLKKFRITGTQTTMRMCRSLWGEDNPEIEYGLTCTSGPLGGDAQIAALMCMEDLGALIFFIDPLSAHPHQADIDSLNRLANCGNIIVCPNPTSAMSMIHTFRRALETGNRGMMPSFFSTLESPAVAEYKTQQEHALVTAVGGGVPAQEAQQRTVFGVDRSMHFTQSTLNAIDPSSHLFGNLDDTGRGSNGSNWDEDTNGGSDVESVDAEEMGEAVANLRRLSIEFMKEKSQLSDITAGNYSTQLAGINIPRKKKKNKTKKLISRLSMSLKRRTSSAS